MANTSIDQAQLKELEARLQARLQNQIEETRQVLLQSDDEQYIALAGEVHDLEEASVADLLVDVSLAEVDRHIEEIREIEAALLRVSDGSYGRCLDCGGDIAFERLQANPAAKRCTACQTQYEKTHVPSGHASL